MVYFQRRELLGLALTGFTLVACGGGQSSSNSAGPVQIASAGSASAQFTGHPKPLLTVSSGNVSVAALAGASFTSVIVLPAPTLNNTYLTYTRLVSETEQEVYSIPYGGSVETALTHNPDGAIEPSASKLGYIYFSKGATESPYDMRPDGSYQLALTYAQRTNSFLDASVSPDGTKVAWIEAFTGLLYGGYTGGSTTTLAPNAQYASSIAWSPSGSVLAFSQLDSSKNYAIYTVPIGGGMPTDVSEVTGLTGNFSDPSWNADGTTLCANFYPSGGSAGETMILGTNTSYYENITPSGDSDYTSCFSPDGNQIAIYRTNAGGAAPGIYLSNVTGTQQQLFLADNGSEGGVHSISWSPFPGGQALLGTNSNLTSTTVSGFLVSQVTSQFGSICGFATTTPSTATIAASSSNGYQPLVFTLSGDNITLIEYTSNFWAYHNGTAITPSGTTPSAVVSVDAVTGAIDTVATALDPASKVASRVAGGNLVYSGRFSGIYDSKGNSLAASGASEIVLNPKTGKLVSFH
jgi:hypothetical protein